MILKKYSSLLQTAKKINWKTFSSNNKRYKKDVFHPLKRKLFLTRKSCILIFVDRSVISLVSVEEFCSFLRSWNCTWKRTIDPRTCDLWSLCRYCSLKSIIFMDGADGEFKRYSTQEYLLHTLLSAPPSLASWIEDVNSRERTSSEHVSCVLPFLCVPLYSSLLSLSLPLGSKLEEDCPAGSTSLRLQPLQTKWSYCTAVSLPS